MTTAAIPFVDEVHAWHPSRGGVDWKKLNRDIACAHLGDLATRAFRDGDTAKGIALLGCTQEVADQPHPELRYREGIARAAGLLTNDADAVEQADAAVAAVLRGEVPPGSLPARFRALWAVEDKIANGRRSPFPNPRVGRKPLVERLRALLVANAAHRVLQLLGGAQEEAEIEPLTPEDNITADKIFDVVRLREEDHDVVRALIDAFPRCEYKGCCGGADGQRPATATKMGELARLGLPNDVYCDVHAPAEAVDFKRAPQIRALLNRMKTWSPS